MVFLSFLSKIDEMKNQHEQTLWWFFCLVSESIINWPKLAGLWINYELARIVQPWSTSVVNFLWNLVDIYVYIYIYKYTYIYTCTYTYTYVYIYMHII
jgi:hypothetical protein